MTQGFNHVVYGVIGIVCCIAIIVMVIAFAPYLGLTSYLHQGFFIESPDVIVPGTQQTLKWSVSDAGIAKYPTEKIEICRGESFGMQCVTVADTVPNSRSARVKIPTTVPTGGSYIQMTAKNAQGNLVSSASSRRPVTVVRAATITTGQMLQLAWSTGNPKSTVKIEFCTPANPTSKCTALVQKATNSGAAQVIVPKGIAKTAGYIVVRQRTLAGILVVGAPQYGTVKSIKATPSSSAVASSGESGSGGGGGSGGSGGGGGESTPVTTASPLPGVTVGCQGVNVKDFHAKGDGSTNDTAAIQQAATSAGKSKSVLCFPAGRYIISGEITFNAYGAVRSDGAALIEQTCATCKIFVFLNQYAVTVQNIKFLGGTRQIAIVSPGSQNSTLSITGSEFEGSLDYAISAGNTSGGILPGSLLIDRSKIVKPRKVLQNSVASALVRDTWVTISKQNFDTNSAAFWNKAGAALVFDNMMGTPSMGSGDAHLSNTRWVDNYGSFTATQSRFGGEDAGIPPVYEFNGGSYETTSVNIQDSQISAGATAQPDSAVIVLKDVIPRSITLSGNNFPIGSPYIRALGLDVAQYIASQHPSLNIHLDANVAYPSNPDIPVELEVFTHRKIPSTL